MNPWGFRALLWMTWAIVSVRALSAADCDENGVDDILQLRNGSAADCNVNGILDACELSVPGVRFERAEGPTLGSKAILQEVVDLDGDGDSDLVFLDYEANELSILIDQGGLRYQTTVLQFPDGITHASKGDFDRDGDQDLLLTSVNHSAFVILWNSRKWVFPNRSWGTLSISGRHTVADLDADGIPDLISWRSQSCYVSWGLGDGSFSEGEFLAAPFSVVCVMAGDLDGDGFSDIVLGDNRSSAPVGIIRNLGGRTFESMASLPQVSAIPAAILLADRNGDGDTDLVIGAKGAIHLFENQGLGVFGPPTSYEVGDNPRCLGAADINSDGRLDLVFATGTDSGGSHAVGFLIQIGDRFVDPIFQMVDAYVEACGAANLDGVSSPALVVSTRIDPSPTFWTMRPTDGVRDCDDDGILDECEADCDSNGVPDACDIQGGKVPDVDGNGVPDACDPDCNRNGVPDVVDILAGTSPDCNENGVPDECDVRVEFSLGGPRSFLLGHAPLAVAAGDLDGDGGPEVVVAVADPPEIEILQSRGGSLSRIGRIPRVPSPRQLRLSDLDADGDVDILAWDPESKQTTICENLGTGNFLAPRPLGPRSSSLGLIEDLDADGRAEFIVTEATTKFLFVAWNLGDLNLSEPAAIGAKTVDSKVEAADIDVDGDLDLIFLASSGPWTVRNLGGRTLGAPGGSGLVSSSFAVVDFEEDGDPDLLCWGGGTCRFACNDGSGHFELSSTVEGLCSMDYALPADMDGDEIVDLVCRHTGPSSVTVLWNEPGLGFTRSSATSMTTSSPLSLADLDGDGLPEVITTDYREQSLLWLRNAGGRRLEGPESLPFVYRPKSLVLSDFDGDGDLDLAGPTPNGVAIALNDSDGGFAELVDYRTWESRMLVPADMDGDGDMDLVSAAKLNGIVAVQANDGQGRFDVLEAVELTETVSSLDLADLDADGDVDAVAGFSGSGGVRVLLNGGDGRLSPGVPFGQGLALRDPHLGDMDGDAVPDLVARGGGASREIQVFRGQGDGEFSSSSSLITEAEIDALVVVDVTGDGFRDVVCLAGPQLHVMRGDGKGKLTIEYTRAERSGSDTLVSGDFDGDGDVDVAWGAGDLQVRLNDGNGTLEEAYSIDTGLIGVSAMAAGDLDGDGRLDLVVGDADGQGIVLVRNRSSSRSSDTRQPGVPDECHAVEFHRGDPNGDSRTDVTDAIFILRFLFFDGETPLCSEAADADNDGSINITDGIVILRFLFLGASSLPSPGEVGLPCGVDPDPPGSVGDLGCSSYAACTDG